MGSFYSTCAITRLPIFRQAPVVCVRVDLETEKWPGQHWDEANRENHERAVIGVWRGVYNDYGTIDEAPEVPDEKRFQYVDVLIFQRVWDAVVVRERSQHAEWRAAHAADESRYPHHWEEGRYNPLVNAYRRAEFSSVEIWDRWPDHLPAEYYEKWPGVRHTSWPWWLDQLGWVMNFAASTRINLLGAFHTRDQNRMFKEIEFLHKLERTELSAMRRKLRREGFDNC